MAAPKEAAKAKPPLHVYQEAKVGTRFFSLHGIDSTRYNGVCALTGSVILMCSGRFVLFVDMQSGMIEPSPGPVNGGVGAVAVHPTRRYYVVCEKAAKDPLIRAHAWPSRAEVGVFVGGALKGFSACCFNTDGSKMATVSMYPDFSLAVWDWKSRGMILRNKCHGADVFSVLFSPFDSGVFVTGGAGHIKFWTMAKTFTGLKLQGLLGKFGRLEISNVPGFVVLPDGKVLSGSESGLILLWEGDLVRCCFARTVLKGAEEDGPTALAVQSYDYTPCHTGAINVVMLLGNGRVVLTAGDDGYMRYWRVSELEAAEGEGLPPLYAPECLCEVLVDANAHIRAVTHCPDVGEWTVLDSTGVLWRVPFLQPDEILAATSQSAVKPAMAALRFNGGGITSAAMSPCDHTVVTGGEDGSIRLIDYVSSREIYNLRLPLPNTVVALQFLRTDASGMKFIACCLNGTVRLLQRGKTAFTLLGQWRPHRDGLKSCAIDRAERRLCTVSTLGTAFFFDIEPDLSTLHPIGFCRLPLPDVACAAWDDDTSCCLIGHECGRVLAITAPLMEAVNHSVSFEFTCKYALVGLRQRKKVEKAVSAVAAEREEEALDEEEEEEDVGPWPVRLICPLPDGTFAIGAGAAELLYQYTTRIRYDNRTELPPLPATGIEPPDYVEEPIINLCYRDCIPQRVYISTSERYMVILCDGAQMLLRSFEASGALSQKCLLAASAHDRLDGIIAAACTSFDDTMMVSVGSDGLVVAQVLNGCNPPKPVKFIEASSLLSAEEIVAPKPIPLSISEQKEVDDRRRAEEAKQRELDAFLAKLSVVHAKYAELLEENNATPTGIRLSDEELALHPQILQELKEEKKRRVQESRKGNALELARENMRTLKMRRRFVDNLLYDRFLVCSFSQEFAVASFRTPDPAEAVRRLELEIEELHSSDGGANADGVHDSDGEENKRHTQNAMGADGAGDPSLSTAAGIMQWLAAEEEKHQQLRLKQSRQGGEMLTSTMRQYLDKMDERREERWRRKKGYEILLAHKPDPAVEAARVEEEIKCEVARRGECVLRTDPLYQSKPSAVEKLRQLIKLEWLLVELRSGFTKKLFEMRNEKRELCESLNQLLRRIRDINESLKDESEPSADVCLTSQEMPEQRFAIDREGLDSFSKQRQDEKAREEMAKKAQRGFGADLAANHTTGASVTTTGAPPSDTEGSSKRTPSHLSLAENRASVLRRLKNPRTSSSAPKMSRAYSTAFLAAAAVRERMDYELRVKLENVKLTEAEEEEQQMERERLLAERRRLQARVRAIMNEFDSRLWEMYEERARVDADLCLAHTRSLLLFQEYQILLVFRKKDRELRLQYEDAKSLRDKRQQEMEDLRRGVREQAGMIEKLQDTNKAFRHEVEYFVEANFPAEHVPYIMKVFLRQIKRRKHQGDMTDDDDDITSDDDDDEEEVGDDLWEEVCPPHCSEDNWCEVLAKRETRLDYADAIAEVRRQQEVMQARIDEHVALAEQHNAAVTMCLKAIEDFQSEKRKQLNTLETLVTLRCSQVKCLDEEEKCPDTFRRDDLVVVSDLIVSGLHRRIATMAEEKRDRHMTLRGMAGELQQLQRGRAAKQALHAQWEEKIYEAMLLKFGQIVNLELLESTSGCREVEELKERLRIEEFAWEKEIRKRESKIIALRNKLQGSLVHNTHLLHDLGDQENDRQDVERSLSQATQKVVSRMYDGSNVATAEDRHNLQLLITAQQEEIDALNAEVAMLRSKGGHVYVPAAAETA
ncbi:flagellar associated protein [Trypanosoma grayi]|uniref:flagellar associated protein n=1 Tax=Trypanosoma grayi TaxID=71804 RepID=UPI0004F3F119|nr:flagellar associated protein [Trypanosoma grayi]KEG14826.1 flagellar associated protein [Trypanosoma grayi]